jgi:hypothetical protein
MRLWKKRSRGEDGESEARVSTPSAGAAATGEPLIITAINRPVEYTRSVAKEGFTTLLATGIVNPFGPTLTVLRAEGDAHTRGESLSPVLKLVLNPFLQNCEQVGIARPGDTWSLESQLPPFFPLYAEDSCPTLLMHSSLLGHDQAVGLYTELLATFKDGMSVLEGVRRYPGDPVNRVQEQMEALGAIVVDADRAEQETDRRLTAAEARELAENLLDPDTQDAETKAFLYAWQGSIEFQGSGEMAENALSLADFTTWFASVATSCSRLPGFRLTETSCR